MQKIAQKPLGVKGFRLLIFHYYTNKIIACWVITSQLNSRICQFVKIIFGDLDSYD